jgi:hypothetical protein
MKFLEKLNKKPRTFQRTFGLSLKQFGLFINQLENVWVTAEKQRKSHDNRKRNIGAGHPYKFQSLEHKLLIVLLYYKLYLTQEFLGIIVDLDQANVSRLLKKMSPLIEKAADPELATYLESIKNAQSSGVRINTLAELVEKYPDLREIAIDAEEQQCYRSKKNEIQKHYYSGKKKRHTAKVQLSVSKSGRILDVSDTYGGSVHDKTVLDKEKTIHKIPTKTCIRFDSGYQGARQENSDHYIVLPTKKPKGKDLSKLAKEHNQINSRRRVIVEHVISRVKKFRICSDRYRGPIESHNQTVRNVASILNFKLANPAVIM